jgi:hypothetical protein
MVVYMFVRGVKPLFNPFFKFLLQKQAKGFRDTFQPVMGQ